MYSGKIAVPPGGGGIVHIFVPIAIETISPWGNDAKKNSL
jgi:hypothetical protein